eukprot:CAMPEP_0181214044 /NCGR_PEP_ID=MMETSP1096-20121128/25238_1 /TAXON_ID=156174 ORGANISM="Chrysochromulina ericina, Strain CCMP281" /NCGR_SAMPLE_ID=MMETSP1096 /ASSEMBLY_ACC=CAM_ASM_000453 /LENGTH=131 /DNA_ID=CAMNT_0023305743 /DNA_START=216 /DNA_END=611 /DNA_ORIENTATION=-
MALAWCSSRASCCVAFPRPTSPQALPALRENKSNGNRDRTLTHFARIHTRWPPQLSCAPGSETACPGRMGKIPHAQTTFASAKPECAQAIPFGPASVSNVSVSAPAMLTSKQTAEASLRTSFQPYLMLPST